MANLFNEADLAEVRRLSPEVPRIGDVGSVPERFQRRFAEQGRFEEQFRQQDLEQSFLGSEQQRRQTLAGLSARLGGGEGAGLGAFGQSKLLPQELGQTAGLSEKEISKAIAPEIQKNFRVQGLKEQILSREIPFYSQIFNRDLQRFGRAINSLRQRTVFKLQGEIEESQKRLQIDYNRSVRELKSKIARRTSAGNIFGNILGGTLAVAGAIGGAFAGGPAGAAALGSAGFSLGRGVGKAVSAGGPRFRRSLQTSIDF